MTSRSEVHRANHYTIEASYKKGQNFYVEVYNVLLFCEVKIKMYVTYNEWILILIPILMGIQVTYNVQLKQSVIYVLRAAIHKSETKEIGVVFCKL